MVRTILVALIVSLLLLNCATIAGAVRPGSVFVPVRSYRIRLSVYRHYFLWRGTPYRLILVLFGPPGRWLR